MKKLYSLMAAALICAPAMQAQTEETIFTYAQSDAETLGWGWGKLAPNDVAIHISNPSYAGYEVVGISVDIPYVEGCEIEPIGKAWLTSELTLDPDTYKNIPNIGEPVEGEIVNYGTEDAPQYRLDIDFPVPYVLSAEGVYVGYTLNVTKLKNYTQKYPVAVQQSNNPEGGLFVHVEPKEGVLLPPGWYQKWTDQGTSSFLVSTMRVILRGEKISHGASLLPDTNFYAETGSSKPLNAILYNYGSEAIQSVDYSVTFSGNALDAPITSTGTLTLDTPLQPELSLPVSIDVAIPEASGNYSATLSTDKVNGEDNLFSTKSRDFSLIARSWIPRKRVLLEEYTGLWCMYCPEAYVIIKQLQDERADDFVTIAYHTNDALQGVSADNRPSQSVNAPAIFLDRVNQAPVGPTAPEALQESYDVLAPADINVEIFWTDADHNAIKAEAKVKFLDDSSDDRYRITYALVEDDMSDSSWNQRNNFWDASSYTSDYYKTPYWDLFIGKGFEVPGIVYDDVAILFPETLGIEGSLPAEITADETYTHSTILKLEDAKCNYTVGTNYGNSLIKNADKLRVVAMLIDTTTGKAVNVNTSGYSADAKVYGDTSGADVLPADAEVISTDYYTLSGMRLASAPAEGAYIAVRHLSNGKTVTAKYLHPLQ